MRIVPFASTLVLALASVLAGSPVEAQTPGPPPTPLTPLPPPASPAPAPFYAPGAYPAPPPSAYYPPPGAYYVSPGKYASPPTSPPPARRKTPMLVSGIVVGAVGAALLVGGGVLFAQGQAANSAPGANTDIDEDGGPGLPALFAGVLMLIVGGLHVVVSLPLIWNGAQPPSRATMSPPAVSWMVPSVGGGPRSTGLRWTF